jgi:hypothetical protein
MWQTHHAIFSRRCDEARSDPVSSSHAASVALADNERRDAIIAQTATALASADYSGKHCPALRIDDDLIKENAQEAETTVDALRADESYAEQVAAIQSVEKSNGRAMVCMVLPSAHGGLARGIITVR